MLEERSATALSTEVPTEVTEAISSDFGCLITGYLCDVVFDAGRFVMVGRVYGDARCRFPCGQLIRTSRILAVEERFGGKFDLIFTVTGSCYVICSWLEGAPKEQERYSSYVH